MVKIARGDDEMLNHSRMETTVIHELLHGDGTAEERSVHRLSQEGIGFTSAGAETTAGSK